MTVNILIIENDISLKDTIENKYSNEKYNTAFASHSDAMLVFEEMIPHLVIIDASDIQIAKELTERMMEFDHTACVFGVSPIVNAEIKAVAFESGMRAIIQSTDLIEGSEEIEEVLKTVTSACNELQNDKCLKCWENNIFTDLTIKA